MEGKLEGRAVRTEMAWEGVGKGNKERNKGGGASTKEKAVKPLD